MLVCNYIIDVCNIFSMSELDMLSSEIASEGWCECVLYVMGVVCECHGHVG